MHDFGLRTEEQVYANEKSFLLSVKQMTPRWLNSIPDSEYGAKCTIAEESYEGYDCPVIVETGAGAGTQALVRFAAKYGGHVCTWDISSAKAAVIRQVCKETLTPPVGDVRRHWTHVPWMSTSCYLGISKLSELGKKFASPFTILITPGQMFKPNFAQSVL